MWSILPITVLLAALQLAQTQRITAFTACLYREALRLDCWYTNMTANPLKYQFTQKNDQEEVIASTIQSNFYSKKYGDRITVNASRRNLVGLYLSKFSPAEKAIYTCKLQIDNDYMDKQTATVAVKRDHLERCGAVGLTQSVSWLLLLLSPTLLQAANVVSL